MGPVRFQVCKNDNFDIVDEIHRVVVHTFTVSDVEDPDLYAAEPLHQWQESDPGKFVMEHAIDKPIWQRQHDYSTYGYRYAIIAELEKKKLSEFYLRWGKANGNN